MHRHLTPRLVRRSAVAMLLATLTACGDDGSTTEVVPAESAALVESTSTAPTAADSSVGTAAPETTPATAPATEPAPAENPEAEAILDRILLTADDLGEGWVDVADDLAMPHDADIARSLPSCAPYAELVFDGGSQNLGGRSRALGRQQSVVFVYGVVFENAEQAAEMVSAVGSTNFDQCWADFNVAAVKQMPFGVTEAEYAPVTPPSLDLDADSVAVKYLTGSFTIGGSPISDSCVCVFAQVDRVVVALHSADIVLAEDLRTAAVQAGIDKARAALASA